jgi:hypothetical protein
MIYFEIDGIEYTANITPTKPYGDSVGFTSTDGTALYISAPTPA